MSDYRVEVRVRNANILRLMEERGIKTVSELCRNAQTCNATFGDVINLKKAPVIGRVNGFHLFSRYVNIYL